MLHPAMRKDLQLALMASLVIAIFLSLAMPYLQAESSSGAAHAVITSSTDDSGHKVYVNESFPVTTSKRSEAPTRNSLAFWSATEHRWKAVPSANIRAARSAAAEVNQTNFAPGKAFSAQD